MSPITYSYDIYENDLLEWIEYEYNVGFSYEEGEGSFWLENGRKL